MLKAKKMIGIFLAMSFLLVIGCGSSSDKSGLKKGDVLETLEELRERGEVQLADSYNEGFSVILPKGSKLKVLYTPSPTVGVFECVPIEINGVTDPDEIETMLIPERIRVKEEYKEFSITLKKEYVGTKLKKIENGDKSKK
ncbi:MAG: hypothetical protein N2053_05495 [Chitinispirillaceae bacterium]|nr:hypothetical protein [Chitinispirillaceae bacterium]